MLTNILQMEVSCMKSYASKQWTVLMKVILLVIVVGCSPTSPASNVHFLPVGGNFITPASITTERLYPSAAPCTGGFVTQTLEHVTTPSTADVHQFESNGTGVAVNDLNKDGLLDIVLANFNGPSSIFWNRGNFVFEKQELREINTRAVNIVDVDGDGWQDIIFTHVNVGPGYWHNTGALEATGKSVFEHSFLPHVNNFAHSMAWADLNHDNVLDLVTGSYDAELNQLPGGSFLFSDGAGVYYYAQEKGTFKTTRLSKKSQALAIALFDVNQDGQTDILVGNDFDFPDQAWVNAQPGWQSADPFSRTTQHTMSYDWGDIDNNGSYDFFATDMNPYQVDINELAQWVPMMRAMPHRLSNTDVQRAQNVLQVSKGNGVYREEAGTRGVIATGWSWSGKFGDLNNDGFLDLYTVNGMIDSELFDYLPGGELVEANQALINLKNGSFAPSPTWNLDSLASGRGMSLADFNNDGRLDIVVNNLRSNALIFQNQICDGGSLQVDLFWPGSQNTRAIGAQLRLETSAGVMLRDVRSGSGYLSGDPARIHFGVPANANLTSLEILWPDGGVTQIAQVSANSLMTIQR